MKRLMQLKADVARGQLFRGGIMAATAAFKGENRAYGVAQRQIWAFFHTGSHSIAMLHAREISFFNNLIIKLNTQSADFRPARATGGDY